MAEDVATIKLQKYIIPSIMIACKYEEYYPPSIEEIFRCYLPSQRLDPKAKQYILNLELELLGKLDLKIFVPPVLDFLTLINHYNESDGIVRKDSAAALMSCSRDCRFFTFRCSDIALYVVHKAHMRRNLGFKVPKYL